MSFKWPTQVPTVILPTFLGRPPEFASGAGPKLRISIRILSASLRYIREVLRRAGAASTLAFSMYATRPKILSWYITSSPPEWLPALPTLRSSRYGHSYHDHSRDWRVPGGRDEAKLSFSAESALQSRLHALVSHILLPGPVIYHIANSEQNAGDERPW